MESGTELTAKFQNQTELKSIFLEDREVHPSKHRGQILFASLVSSLTVVNCLLM